MHRFPTPARRWIALTLLPALLVFVWITAFPWGSVGHRFINTKVVHHLRKEMTLSISDSSLFGQHASDADYRKSADPTEDAKHYIDDFPDYVNLPQDYDSVVGLYGSTRVMTNGTLPWATLCCYDSLVAQLARGDWAEAVLRASDLGHYVGDGYQPLHVAVNSNGQLTGNKGIHSRSESDMLSSSYYGNALVIHPDTSLYVDHRPDYVFAYLLRSNGLVDSILHDDTYATTSSGWSRSGNAPANYYTALSSEVGSMTLEQMQRATVSLASLWYSAWVDAGLISTAGAPPAAAGSPPISGSSRITRTHSTPPRLLRTFSRWAVPCGCRSTRSTVEKWRRSSKATSPPACMWYALTLAEPARTEAALQAASTCAS